MIPVCNEDRRAGSAAAAQGPVIARAVMAWSSFYVLLAVAGLIGAADIITNWWWARSTPRSSAWRPASSLGQDSGFGDMYRSDITVHRADCEAGGPVRGFRPGFRRAVRDGSLPPGSPERDRLGCWRVRRQRTRVRQQRG